MSGKPFVAILIEDRQDYGVTEVVSEIPIDVCKSRTYRYQAQITDFPVESGASITDHRRKQPDVVEIEGLVSATPLVVAPTTLGLKGDSLTNAAGAPAPLQAAHDALLSLHEKGTLVTIVTDYRTHEDMALESLEIQRSKETGRVFEFRATFKQLRIVATSAAALPASVLKKLKLKNRPKVTRDEKVRKYNTQLSQQVQAGKISPEESKKRLGDYAKSIGAKVPKA